MDSRKRLIVTSVISIILVSILMIGSTYSIFNSTDVDEEANVYKTGALEISLEDAGNVTLDFRTPVSLEGALFLTPYHLKVTNHGTVPYKFNLVLEPTTATDEIAHQFIMTKVGQLEPKSLDASDANIIREDIILLAGKSVDIDVRVWISDMIQNTEINKSFSAKLKVDGVATTSQEDEVDNHLLVAEVPLKLGDYVSFTPMKESYTTNPSMTGYSSSQTIYPKELNLWRVIGLNLDGTVDIISENVSSTEIYFGGIVGYQNFVGYLNVLASQYEDNTYTVKSRCFGYNTQTEYIKDNSYFVDSAPFLCSTGEVCSPSESKGGGDTLYQRDYEEVNTILKTRVATKPGSNEGTSYWMASRFYSYVSNQDYSWIGRGVNDKGEIQENDMYRYKDSLGNVNSYRGALRPILTLKSKLKFSGEGTKNNPIQLSE